MMMIIVICLPMLLLYIGRTFSCVYFFLAHFFLLKALGYYWFFWGLSSYRKESVISLSRILRTMMYPDMSLHIS